MTRNAKIVDQRDVGESKEDIFSVLATGFKPFSEFNARRAAKTEVHPLIPLRDQEVINLTVDRDLGFRKRYLITIAHNSDAEDLY
jgi:hypothetical protein